MTHQTAGMPKGSEGAVLQVGAKKILVSFWDGGPLRVPLTAVELVERLDPWLEEPRD